MAGKFSKEVEKLMDKYQFELPPHHKQETRFGHVSFVLPNSSLYGLEKKLYKVMVIEAKKEFVNALNAFFREIKDFQNTLSKDCGLLKIKEFYKDPKENTFYIIQRDYNRCLAERRGKLSEIEILLILYQICKLYERILQDPELVGFFQNEKLGIKPLMMENITYYRHIPKTNGKLKQNRLLVNFIDFCGKNEDFYSQIDAEKLHLQQFKSLVLDFFFEKRDEESIKKKINDKENKWFGPVTKNLVNTLMQPDLQLTWPIIFQNPTLHSSIKFTPNIDHSNVWKIQKRDRKIQIEWVLNFEEVQGDQFGSYKKIDSNEQYDFDSGEEKKNDQETTEKRGLQKQKSEEMPKKIKQKSKSPRKKK